jgi:hypothetical protein
MKWLGILLVVLCGWIVKMAWYDTIEGPPTRAVCYIVIVVGVVLFFEGLKREIIAALHEDRKP